MVLDPLKNSRWTKKEDRPVAVAEKEVKGYRRFGRWVSAHDRTIVLGINAVLALVGEHYIRKHNILAKQTEALKAQVEINKATAGASVSTAKKVLEGLKDDKDRFKKVTEGLKNVDERALTTMQMAKAAAEFGKKALEVSTEQAKKSLQTSTELGRITATTSKRIDEEFLKLGEALAKSGTADKIANHPEFKKWLAEKKNLKNLRPLK